jgi:hypothetical protein
MLNPESVDKKGNDLVEIQFTDEVDDEALTIILKKHDAMDLAKMIQNKCSYAAEKKERG